MSAPSAHIDRFASTCLPDPDQWPEFRFSLPELQYPELLNCAGVLIDSAIEEGHGERIALYSDDGHWTYQALFNTANHIAHRLQNEYELVPGNRVLIRGMNSPMMVASWLAVMKAGGICVATMPLLRAAELEYIIEKAQVSHCLCDARLREELSIAIESSASVQHQIIWGPQQALDDKPCTEPVSFETLPTRSDDLALIAFTSGTTGQPKAAMHFHRDVLAQADVVARHLLKTRTSDIYAGSPPIAFTFGLGAQLVFPLRFRAAVALSESPAPDKLLGFVERHRVTCLFTAPTAYRVMLSVLDNYDISSLEQCVSAGEPLPETVAAQWYEATGIRIIDGLGSTEMMHIFVSSADEDIRPGAIGKALPGYEACVLSEEGEVLPPDNTGRLAVRGPTGCRYMDDSRQADYVVNGWNVTGDVMYQDKDGYFFFRARNDDMIISSGYNIAGPEVEAALLSHPAVTQCAVIGAPDSERGQVVKAFVVLADEYSGSEDLVSELQDHVKQSIAPYKYPREVVFIRELPKTPTGKIQRYVLRQAEQAE